MALAIATNTGALMAAASATSVNKDMETSMERLSTGKRINSAKDDAAGVAIASRLTSEIRGTNQAIRNAQDGQALINTAEGAHKEIENILQRMRELAVQASNDTNDSTDRSNLQAEFEALTTEIDRIAGATTWAGQDLLTGVGGGSGDGTFNLQVGGNTGDVDKITVSISAMTTAALGASDSTVEASDAETAVLTGDFSDFTLANVDADVTVTIDGVDLTVDAADATSLDDIVTSLNANTDNTDWTFSASGTDLIATAKTEGATVSTFTVTGGGTEDLTATTPAAAAVLTAAMSSSEITFADVDADITVTIDSVALTVAVADFSAATDEASLVTALAASLNANADNTDWTFSASGTDLVATANTAGATVSTFTIASTGTDDFTGATVAETTAGADLIGFSVTETTAGADAVTAAGAFDISTRDAALASIVLMDAAISTVNTQRAELGAVSNRLDNTVSNLTNISINLEGGRGRIEDADFAAESTSLAKSQILQQASTAMLAQANASKQSVLSLLQG